MKLSGADLTENRLTFNSHKVHNPNCDILELKISKDAYITYYIDINTRVEGMEYYSGSNYVVGSSLKSHSNNYPPNLIPKKYRSVWHALKYHYENKIKSN